MPLSFNANVPQASQTIATTQAPILTNFQSIDTAFNGQGGGGAGGGNFTTYSFQNVTANFASKPTNPVGILYAVQDSSGNPQLAWINNANAQGAGPYTGVQLTGGGVTAAAWVTFAGSSSFSFTPSSINSSNIASITRGSRGVYTINFTTNFSSTTYCCVPTASPYLRISLSSQTASAITLTFQNVAGQTLDPNSVNVVFFGILT